MTCIDLRRGRVGINLPAFLQRSGGSCRLIFDGGRGGIGVTEEHVISHYFRRFTTFARRFGSQADHLARFAAAADSLEDA